MLSNRQAWITEPRHYFPSCNGSGFSQTPQVWEITQALQLAGEVKLLFSTH